ncbi:uncharacterized protein LOC118220448 isoform X2 [Anguilla anguilla]|uniref:uncharacterized protein LOC118220448 isoform X2 n=1 Tax=Anguilla anguilla TaxID=7936 RepID=UPI0015B200D6|nr:uncharacterized protein LOC118220448 isoform X2 [Anguilla anguilla]
MKNLHKQHGSVFLCVAHHTDTPIAPTSLFPLMTCPTDQLTLACIAGGFFPSSSVTFQWKDTSGQPVSDFTEYPAVQISGSKSYTSVSHLRVNAAEWDAKKTYSCSVNHLSQAGVKDASFQKPVMPKSPTVSLLLEPSGASPPDALICVIRDFYPKSLTVTWRVNGKTLTGSSNTWQSEKQASGLYSASSTVNVDRTKWDRNEEYTCEVLHQQETIKQKTSRDQSLDTPCLEVTLNPPKARELFVDNQAVLDCVITGGERAAVEGASVTWTPSGTSKESQITQHGHVFRKTSTLTLGQERWFTEQNVQCSVQQQNSKKPAITKSFSRNTSGLKAPKVVINTPSEEDSEFVSLVCVVTGFSPRDVFVMWSVDGSYEEGITSEPVESNHGNFSVTSFLEVPTAKWKSQSKVACNVKHVSVPNGAAPLTKSVSRATDPPCLEVTLNPPKARELFVNNQAVLDCVITGGEKAAVEGASVTWTPSGTSTSSEVTQHGHVFRKTSTLTLGQERWFTEQNVQCSVQQQNSDKPAITKSFSRNNSGLKVPKVDINTPSEEDSEFVSLVCVVTGFSPRDVSVMWTVDGSYEEGITSEPVESNHGNFSVTSFLEVPTAKWKSQSKVACNVKHVSVSNGAAPLTKSVSRVTDPPCLEVTLNPPKARELFVNNQAVLDCVITGGEKAAVEGASVTWTPSGTSTSSEVTQHGHVFRKTSTLTLGQERWFTEQNVQCSVQQQNSDKPAITKSFSRNNSGLKVPKVDINTPSEEDSEFVSLVCVVTGFSPRDVSVMWTVDGSYEEGITSEPVESNHGNFSVTSFLEVPTAKWKSQSKVACNVKHVSVSNGAAPLTKSVSRVTDPPCLEVTLNPPKARELFVNNQAVLDCVITGGERAAVEGASVTWTPSGTSKESQITQHGHVFRKTSTLTLGQERWFTEQNVECSVQQQNSDKPAITKSFSRNNTGSTVPKVVIYTPSEEEDSEFVSLVCVVTGFSPRDVFVMWTVDDGSYEEGITSEPVESKTGTFSVTSLFNVSTAKWKSPSNITCNVKHSSMANGAAPLTKSVSRATETVSALNCNEEGEEEDELGSLWSTTSSFFTLFLCTLIYSTLLTLIKMKQ